MADGVIVASPIRQAPHILAHFLASLRDLEGAEEVWLYDDNDDPASCELVRASGFEVLPRIPGLLPAPYWRWQTTHYWTTLAITRVARIKDAILARAHQVGKHLFLVDSDLCLHPQTLVGLLGAGTPVVSEVFWTAWQPGLPYLPQSWDVHPGGFSSPQSITRLRTPGQYPVAGLGACTLIRREATTLRFEAIPGLPFLGEDRHFCVRAGALGIPLALDTTHPAFHLYRDPDIDELPAWRGGTWLSRLDVTWEASVQRWFVEMVRGGPLERYRGGTEPWTTELLLSLCRAIGARDVLEIGVFRGETTASLAGAAERVIGIDTEITSAAVNRTQEQANVTLLEGDAATVLHDLEGPFDLVFIDDGHQYADVKAQTDAVWPKVRPGGLVLYHDLADDGVSQLLNERFPQALYLATKPFPWAGITGLGIVQKP